MTPLGRRFRALAARLVDPRTMERIVDPAIADLQTEVSQAGAQGRIWTARCVALAGYIGIIKVIGLVASRQVWRSWADLNPNEGAALRKAIAVFAIVTGVVTLALASPPYFYFGGNGLYLIPSALPLSVMVGVTAAIIVALTNMRLTRRLVVVVLASAFACSSALFADMAWITPRTNQAYRERVFAAMAASAGEQVRALPRGDREMGMSELRRQMTLRPDEARRFQQTYHLRWSMSAAPLAVAGLALAILWRQRRSRRVLSVVGICLGYYALFIIAQQMAIWTMLPVIAILWIPNAACAILAVALTWRARPPAAAAR